MKCPFYEMFYLWNLETMKCPVYEIFYLLNGFLWNLSSQSMKCLFMKCPVYKMSYLWNVLSMRCPTYEMSCLWDVLPMKCPICKIFYLWNVLSMKFFIYKMVFYKMSWWLDHNIQLIGNTVSLGWIIKLRISNQGCSWFKQMKCTPEKRLNWKDFKIIRP